MHNQLNLFQQATIYQKPAGNHQRLYPKLIDDIKQGFNISAKRTGKIITYHLVKK